MGKQQGQRNAGEHSNSNSCSRATTAKQCLPLNDQRSIDPIDIDIAGQHNSEKKHFGM